MVFFPQSMITRVVNQHHFWLLSIFISSKGGLRAKLTKNQKAFGGKNLALQSAMAWGKKEGWGGKTSKRKGTITTKISVFNREQFSLLQRQRWLSSVSFCSSYFQILFYYLFSAAWGLTQDFTWTGNSRFATRKILLPLFLKIVIPLLHYKVEKTPENISDPSNFE